MQEEKEEKKGIVTRMIAYIRKCGILNIACSGLFLLFLMSAAGVFLYLHRNTPTNKWGERETAFPWQGEGIRINSLQRGWKSANENKWMKERGITDFPFAEINLGECNGNGTVFVQFVTPEGHTSGKPVSILYRNGNFIATDDPFCKAEGKQAFVYGYPGYTDPHQLILHCMDEDKPHWQVHISHSPETTGARKLHNLGFATVPKNTVYK
ncbi:MAG: hypothetical protein Q4A24_02705 [Akkermansia sp.]|nr:hypothetical protein [Akkermansia sp.]